MKLFDSDTIHRRGFLKTTATLGLASTGLAGCTGGTGGESPTPTPTPESESRNKPTFGGWMKNVDKYTRLVDKTGTDQVAVIVGAPGNGGNFAFDPPAVRITKGSTVVWTWSGKGGAHNVHAQSGADFKSKLTEEEGFTFEHTFPAAGTVKYQCDPHVKMGMKGVIVVK